MIEKIENNTINNYLRFNGKIIICQENSSNFNQAMNYLQSQTILGFDTEARPSFKKGVTNNISLIQFATYDTAILVRLLNNTIPNRVIQILEDEKIIKVGVGSTLDNHNLQKLKKYTPKSFIDLQDLAKAKGIEVFSLKKLCEVLLHKKISKRQQLSNWESKKLSDAQINYAATDAYAAILLYEILKND